jgi:hypothetical protein
MLIGRNHQMTGRVRKQIKDDEVVRRAEKDQTLRVMTRVFSDAEDAS